MKRPLLLPLAPLYAAGLALREMRLDRGWEKVRRLRWPVISVGNLSAGGSGKTPLVIALIRLLQERGFHVDVLSRGYGRRSGEPARVRVDGSADEFGDEPLLIARKTGVPVYVAAERYEAGRLAETEVGEDDAHPRVHLLDDGFQHRQLARDVDVVLVNREDWQDHLLPAGNLREPMESMRRADVVVIPAEDGGLESELRAWGWAGSVWQIRRRMDVPRVDGPVLGFCGIARPEQFFAGLQSAGLQIAGKKAFADHHRYTKSDVESLLGAARKASAGTLITTEKDEVRLGALRSAIPDSVQLRTASLQATIDDEAHIADWLVSRLNANRSVSAL